MNVDDLGSQERHKAVQERFDRIAPRYDRVNRILALGMDRRWRRRAVAAAGLSERSLVIDLGCGTGSLYRELRARGLRIIGFDLSEGMLRMANRAQAGIFVLADALRLPLADGTVDGVFCAFALRDVGDSSHLLAEMYRVLRPGGTLTVLEIAWPKRAWAKAAHRFYLSHAAPAVGAVFSNREAYRSFADSVALLPSDGDMEQMCASVGFVECRRRSLNFGTVQVLVASR